MNWVGEGIAFTYPGSLLPHLLMRYGFRQEGDEFVHLFLGDDEGRRDHHVVTGHAVRTAMAGVEDQPLLKSYVSYPLGEVTFWREGCLRCLVGHELYPPHQSDASYIADAGQFRQCAL